MEYWLQSTQSMHSNIPVYSTLARKTEPYACLIGFHHCRPSLKKTKTVNSRYQLKENYPDAVCLVLRLRERALVALLRLRSVRARRDDLSALRQLLPEVLDGLRQAHSHGHLRRPSQLALRRRDVGTTLLRVICCRRQGPNGRVRPGQILDQDREVLQAQGTYNTRIDNQHCDEFDHRSMVPLP